MDIWVGGWMWEFAGDVDRSSGSGDNFSLKGDADTGVGNRGESILSTPFIFSSPPLLVDTQNI